MGEDTGMVGTSTAVRPTSTSDGHRRRLAPYRQRHKTFDRAFALMRPIHHRLPSERKRQLAAGRTLSSKPMEALLLFLVLLHLLLTCAVVLVDIHKACVHGQVMDAGTELPVPRWFGQGDATGERRLQEVVVEAEEPATARWLVCETRDGPDAERVVSICLGLSVGIAGLFVLELAAKFFVDTKEMLCNCFNVLDVVVVFAAFALDILVLALRTDLSVTERDAVVIIASAILALRFWAVRLAHGMFLTASAIRHDLENRVELLELELEKNGLPVPEDTPDNNARRAQPATAAPADPEMGGGSESYNPFAPTAEAPWAAAPPGSAAVHGPASQPVSADPPREGDADKRL